LRGLKNDELQPTVGQAFVRAFEPQRDAGADHREERRGHQPGELRVRPAGDQHRREVALHRHLVAHLPREQRRVPAQHPQLGHPLQVGHRPGLVQLGRGRAQGRPRFLARGPCRDQLDQRPGPCALGLEDRVLLAGEVVREGAAGHPRLVRDVLDRHPVQAAFHRQPQRRRGQRPPGHRLLLGAERGEGLHAPSVALE
jgi:hypothetical protein